MDIPIRRIPPMVGPKPPAAIPRLGDRPPERKQQFSLDDEEKQNDDGEDGGAEANEDDITEIAEPPQGESLDEVGPPGPDEAGQNLNVII